MAFDPFTEGFNLVSTILDKFFPDADTELKAKLTQAAQAIENDFKLKLEQIEVNKIEAGSASLFKSGWRPAIGWVGAVGLAWNFVGYPISNYIIAILNLGLTPPMLASDNLMELVIAMLGLGAMRSYERISGVIPQGK